MSLGKKLRDLDEWAAAPPSRLAAWTAPVLFALFVVVFHAVVSRGEPVSLLIAPTIGAVVIVSLAIWRHRDSFRRK
ncbi:MAG: hypothetical protein ACR2H3_09685 [Acidimicrobiales bacterium]